MSAYPAILRELAVWGSLVKFPHTVFALPFALSMLLVAVRTHPFSWQQFFWILGALISARTAAMSFNRLVDREIDKKNPRTSSRELPAEIVTTRSVKMLLAVNSLAFLLSALMLGRHCFVLAPGVLALLLFYSWTKRFTSYSHFVLGLALALAPGGVWYAITAEAALVPFVLMLAVLFWVAGFDILYSCQDVEFDREHGLFSLPARIGMRAAFSVSRLLHLLSVLLLVWFGWLSNLGQLYFAGLLAFAAVLASQHLIVSPDDLRRMDQAFFTRNGIASLLFLTGVFLDFLIVN